QKMKEYGAQSVGIYFEDFKGKVFTYNADQSFHAASTMKAPVMMEVFRQVEHGKLKLDQSVLVKNEFKSIIDGSPYQLSKDDDSDAELYSHVGQILPLNELMQRMINHSSNHANNLIIQDDQVHTGYLVVLTRGVKEESQGWKLIAGLASLLWTSQH